MMGDHDYEYTYEPHLVRGAYCKSCQQIPWERWFKQAAAAHIAEHSKLKKDPDEEHDQILAPYILHEDRQQFQDAVERQKCILCKSLWSEWNNHVPIPEDALVKFSLWRSWRSSIPNPGYRPYVDVEFRYISPTRKRRMGWSVELNSDHPGREFVINSVVPRLPLSTATLATMRSWMEDCVNNHPQCRSQLAHNPHLVLPTRLVDLRTEGSTMAYLIESTELDISTKYASLSHCWGTEQPFKLETHNILAHKSGIVVDKLPKTFQDAITVCRLLGLRYVWIDSLCIIQDDLEDWKIESAKMGVVYKNAHVTIAAARASGDTEGFLGPRFADKITERQTRIPEYYEISPGILLYEEVQQFLQQHLSSSPLNRRAWVVQERYLSCRTLSFTQADVFWSCRKLLAKENGRSSLVVTDSLDILANRMLLGDQNETAYEAWASSFNKPFQLWYDLIELYSECRITKSTDRLPALAGMAAEIAKRTNQRYYAGLWEKAIIPGLSWIITDVTDALDYYRAPSWSWVSIEAAVKIVVRGRDYYPIAEFIDAQVQIDSLNPFGEVRGGSLRLCACVLPVKSWTSKFVRAQILDKWFYLKVVFDIHKEIYEHDSVYLSIMSHGHDYEYLCVNALVLSSEKAGSRKRLGFVHAPVDELIAVAGVDVLTVEHEQLEGLNCVRRHTDQAWVNYFFGNVPKEIVVII